MEHLETCCSKVSGERRKCHKYFFSFFKIFLFIGFLSGFIIQEVQFLKFYYTYPEIIDTTYKNTGGIVLPAFTFCLSDSVSRRMYCEKYPLRCENVSSSDSICKEYPRYCDSGQVLKQNDRRITYSEAKYLKREDLLLDPFHSEHYDVTISAPIYYPLIGSVLKCHTMTILDRRYERLIGGQVDPIKRREQSEDGIVHLFFRMDPADFLKIPSDPGIYFRVHSPHVTATPTTKRYFYKAKEEYIVRVRLEEEEHLLPFPYPSDCMNYTALRETMNETGYRSQKDCVDECDMKFDIATRGTPGVLAEYPVLDHHEYSWYENISRLRPGYAEKSGDKYKAAKDLYFSCASRCKPDCLKYKYRYSVEEVDKIEDPFDYWIIVGIRIEDTEVLVRKHRPQYQDGELFSITGGYLGIWLGLSLFAIADYIKYPYTFVAFCWRHLQTRKLKRILRKKPELPILHEIKSYTV